MLPRVKTSEFSDGAFTLGNISYADWNESLFSSLKNVENLMWQQYGFLKP